MKNTRQSAIISNAKINIVGITSRAESGETNRNGANAVVVVIKSGE